MDTPRKTALVVLYNHNYEKNIPAIRSLYGGRFSQLLQLMPFYYGSEPDVVPVYGNSFLFHSFITQARQRMKALDCDDFLIVGDDVLLHPDFNEHSAHALLHLEPGAFYLDGVTDLSAGECFHGINKAAEFCTNPPGLDASANRRIPSYEEAEATLRAKGVLGNTVMRRVKPYWRPFERPFSRHLYANYKILRGHLWHIRNLLKNRFFPKRMSYPCAFGYSDIVSVPRERLDEWCDLLEIFATWQMFVELAIPTATLLLPEVKVSMAPQTGKKTGNVWFPQNPAHFTAVSALIEEMTQRCEHRFCKLPAHFPKEYLYLHPVKLSAFRD